MSKARELLDALKIPATGKRALTDLKKMDYLLANWKKIKVNSFDASSFAWIKDDIVVSTTMYPPNSYNVSIGKLTNKNIPDDNIEMFLFKNIVDREVLRDFGKAKSFGGMDKWDFLKNQIGKR